MIAIAKYPYFNFIFHAFTWSIVLFFPYLAGSAANQYKIGPHPGLYFTLSGIIHIIIFYENTLYLYPKLLNRDYWWLYVVMTLLLVYLSVQLKFFLLERWFPEASPNVRTHIIFPSVLVFVVSTFYSIMIDKIRSEKLQKENEAMQLAMELKLLRSQISPHFLFTILTSCPNLNFCNAI